MSVVAAYTPSELGSAVLRESIDEARRRRTRVVVVNATRGDVLVDPRLALPDQLRTVEAQLSDAGVDFDVVQTAPGISAHDAILDTAYGHDAQLIVIGVRHRTPVGKLLLGSTAQHVILRATMPVLAVKEAADAER